MKLVSTPGSTAIGSHARLTLKSSLFVYASNGNETSSLADNVNNNIIRYWGHQIFSSHFSNIVK